VHRTDGHQSIKTESVSAGKYTAYEFDFIDDPGNVAYVTLSRSGVTCTMNGR
jgi:hypothetical protein